jgi:glycerate 2-kinase
MAIATNKLSSLNSLATKIFYSAIKAVDPEAAVKRFVGIVNDELLIGPNYGVNLSKIARIFVVGAGKASAPMGKAIEDLLGERIDGGVISVKYGHGLPLSRISVREAGHPLPDDSSMENASEILEILRCASDRDLVISCISGGGSALICLPADRISLDEKRLVTSELISSGASIHEINCVRKHLSGIKGGKLMKAAYPADVVNLVLSDVVGDDLDVIASGPFVPDESTFAQALGIMETYGLTTERFSNVLDHFRDGINGKIDDTPKAQDRIFENVSNVIVGSNILALDAARDQAESMGFNTLILSSSFQGDTNELAHFHGAIAEEIRVHGNPVNPPACLLSGGEGTVHIHGAGLGGRNQHFALCLAEKAQQIGDCLFLSAGTDGTDGPTEAAGAFVDSTTLVRAQRLGLNPMVFLKENNSYNFFRELGDLIITGPTRTNVMDVRIVLVV